jgi:hypothetical protein
VFGTKLYPNKENEGARTRFKLANVFVD